MATVTVDVNGRPYAVGCADGQEERVRNLAQQFDTHVRQISGEVGHVGDLRLFLMASLMLADELHEARQRLENGQGPAVQDGPQKAPPPAGDGVAEALNAVAARIEKICQTI
ncbi:Cell division protein ZapA [compost metagenome]